MMSFDTSSPLQITEQALQAIQKIRQDKQIDEKYALRIGVRGSGCSKDDFYLGFDFVKEDDKVYWVEAQKVIVHKAQVLYLFGVILDYQILAPEKGGFVFQHPNAV